MSNLLEKASILLTPTAYSDGTLHSVKPVQTFSNELITNGDFATDTNWTKFSNATISGGTANLPNASAAVRQIESGLETNKNYKITYDVISSSGNNVLFTTRGGTCLRVDLPSSVGTHTVFARTDSTGGDEFFISVKTFSASAVIDNVSLKKVTDGDFDFTRATAATRYNSSGIIEFVDSNIPRINYLGGSCGYWLLEPATINKATYSNDFSQGDIFQGSSNPSLTGAVLSANQGTAPDGTNAAQKLIDNNDGSSGSVAINFFSTNLTSATDSTISVFAKKDGANVLRINMTGFDNGRAAFFNLANGTKSGTTQSSMEDYGNGWYRCSVTMNTTTDLVGACLFNICSDSNQTSIPRNGTQSILLWGMQSEEQSFPTSHIPTSGSTMTRNKEEANSSGDSSLISSTEGVLYVEIAALANDTTSRSISLTSGNNTDRVTIQYRNASNAINAFYRSSNVNIGQIFFSATDITQFSKIAYRYKENDFALFVDGVKVGSVTSGSFSSTLTALSFDRANSNDTQFFGKVKSVAVFKEALTDAELICLTS